MWQVSIFCIQEWLISTRYNRAVAGATQKFMENANLKVKTIMVDEYPNDHDFFNTVYACQLGNGGIDSGDGYRFRGRGFLQITGYVNYESKV